MDDSVPKESVARLELRGISRRDFLRYCLTAATVYGLNQTFGSVFAHAAAFAAKKKPVVWIQGQGCTGCSCSLLSTMNPPVASVLLDSISMRFNSTVMNSAGHVSTKVLMDTITEGGYVLVVEGSIPTADGRYCMVEGMPFDQLLTKAAKNAVAVVAAGTCAAYGGIPRAGITGAKGVSEVVKGKPVVNITGCPMKPEWLLGTLLYFLSFGELPALHSDGRPIAYFGRHFLHDSCPRVAYFERGQFLENWNDPAQANWCLLKVGCKGPVTYADCNTAPWNDGVNSCVRAGSPCAGCVQPEFYAGLAPLYVSPFAAGTPDEMLPLLRDAKWKVDPPSAALGAGLGAAPYIIDQIRKLLDRRAEQIHTQQRHVEQREVAE